MKYNENLNRIGYKRLSKILTELKTKMLKNNVLIWSKFFILFMQLTLNQKIYILKTMENIKKYRL